MLFFFLSSEEDDVLSFSDTVSIIPVIMINTPDICKGLSDSLSIIHEIRAAKTGENVIITIVFTGPRNTNDLKINISAIKKPRNPDNPKYKYIFHGRSAGKNEDVKK